LAKNTPKDFEGTEHYNIIKHLIQQLREYFQPMHVFYNLEILDGNTLEIKDETYS
jgi:hypothetical protein